MLLKNNSLLIFDMQGKHLLSHENGNNKREVFRGNIKKFSGIFWNFIEFYGILMLKFCYFSF
jgi:hypothetical protein